MRSVHFYSLARWTGSRGQVWPANDRKKPQAQPSFLFLGLIAANLSAVANGGARAEDAREQQMPGRASCHGPRAFPGCTLPSLSAIVFCFSRYSANKYQDELLVMDRAFPGVYLAIAQRLFY